MIHLLYMCYNYFFQTYAANNTKPNLVISPLSAWIAASMAAFGTEGSTFEEMKKSLFLPYDRKIALEGFNQLLGQLNVSLKAFLST